MQIDPASTAMQLVTIERQNMEKLLKKQLDSVKGQQSAISSLTTKLSSFQTLLKDLNKATSLQAQKAKYSPLLVTEEKYNATDSSSHKKI